MVEFVAAVAQYGFLQSALIAGLLASVACGVVGSYVAARRMSYMAGGIAHSVLGGMGAARYLEVVVGWSWLQPMHGAIAAAILAAVAIWLVNLRWRESEDTAIGAIWAIGMAVGVLFIYRTPGYSQDLMSYLFGNILMVTPGSLWLMAGLDAVVLVLGLAFYRQLLAITFDPEFARLRGINVELHGLLLLGLTALTVVLLVNVVGLILVIALLTLPVATAGRFGRSLWQVMLVSSVLAAVLTVGGLAVSYAGDLPSGPTIIVLAGGLYLVVVGVSSAVGVSRRRRAAAEPRRTA